jgi:hypothetical protein
MVEANTGQEADDKILKDSKIYESTSDNMDEMSLEFTCRDPQNVSGTVMYKVTAREKDGLFEGQRRYSEFFALHEVLCKMWPGVPVPSIPPK